MHRSFSPIIDGETPDTSDPNLWSSSPIYKSTSSHTANKWDCINSDILQHCQQLVHKRGSEGISLAELHIVMKKHTTNRKMVVACIQCLLFNREIFYQVPPLSPDGGTAKDMAPHLIHAVHKQNASTSVVEILAPTHLRILKAFVNVSGTEDDFALMVTGQVRAVFDEKLGSAIVKLVRSSPGICTHDLAKAFR